MVKMDISAAGWSVDAAAVPGRQLRLGVDTGVYTCVDESVAKKRGWRVTRLDSDEAADDRSDNLRYTGSFTLPVLRCGAASWRGTPVLTTADPALKSWHLDGILGIDKLALATAELRTKAGALILRPPAAFKPRKGDTPIDTHAMTRLGWLAAPGRVGDHAGDLFLDTGSYASFVGEEFANALEPAGPSFRYVRDKSGRLETMRLVNAPSLRFGNVSITGPQFGVRPDIDILNPPADRPRTPHLLALIGRDILGEYDLVLGIQQGYVRLVPHGGT
jgi:hypothetical protein